jgi:integrase/recombinase XerD
MDDFMSRRDTAMISMLLDTGIRLAELAGLKVEDVNVAERWAYVKRRRHRHRYQRLPEHAGERASQACIQPGTALLRP